MIEKNNHKYTINRSDSDIKIINKLRDYLQSNNNNKTFNTDSEIYRDLPFLFLNAVKTIDQLQLQINKLTAEVEKFEDLRANICRIMEIVKHENKHK